MGPSQFLGFRSCAEADLRSFECRACENRCQVNQVHLGKRIVHFGDICERFSQRDREVPAASRPFPELFAAREALLESYLSPSGDPTVHKPRLGLLSTSLNLEFLPLWVRFLSELSEAGVLPSSQAVHDATEILGPDGRVGQLLAYMLAIVPTVWLAGLWWKRRAGRSCARIPRRCSWATSSRSRTN